MKKSKIYLKSEKSFDMRIKMNTEDKNSSGIGIGVCDRKIAIKH